MAFSIANLNDACPIIAKGLSHAVITKGFADVLSVLFESGTDRFVLHGAMSGGHDLLIVQFTHSFWRMT